MKDELCVFLRRILMKSYDHNIRIREMEKAAKGLIRLGGNKREIHLDGIQFELVEEVLDFLGAPSGEGEREHLRNLLNMAGKNEPDPNRIEKALRKIESKIGLMFN